MGPLNCLPKWLYHFAFTLATNESSYCSTSSSAFGGVSFLDFSYSGRGILISIVVLICSSLRIWSEKAVAPHSSTLAWKIPWMEEPGGLQSMGLLRVEHDWATSLSLFTFTHWRRKWQPTPVFLPGESQGPGSLVGCRLWGRTKLDTTEAT